MRLRRILLILFFLLSQTPVLRAKDIKWFQVSSEHFLLYTDTNEMKGRRLVSDFENRVAAFGEAFGKVPARQLPIEILLFSQEPDFIEVLPRVQGTEAEKQLTKSAYLLRGPDRVFIVAKDKSPDDIANDVGHALGHVLFERYGIWRPFWLAEGTAEYVRKIGRSADTKAINEQDSFSAADMFTIVPSAKYNDNDPPTPFRTESYRLVRFLLEQQPDVLRQYLRTLNTASDKLPKISVDGAAIEAQFQKFTETAIKPLLVTAAVQSAEVDASKVAIHRGDVLIATDRQSEASRWYNADSKEARAARAILTRYSRPQPEAIRVLDRASRELPEDGLVQYHFGAIELQDKKDIQAQVAALERAVQLLPLMGRAFAELARVHALNGQAEKSLPLVTKAIELEPEYADQFYAIRSDVHLALGQSAEALQDINLASDLPHADRATVERYTLKIAAVRRRIEAARREKDLTELEALRKEVRSEAEEREPPPKPAPPPPPVPAGNITYGIETRAPIDVVDAVYPDYPEALRKKGAEGTITVQVDIGPDGKVKTASIVGSQIEDLNKATLDAVKKWTFKPGNRNIRLVLKFSL
jgi:TonB family protein